MNPIVVNEDLEIEIEIQSIVNALAHNPAALRAISIAVRDMQTKQVRRMGDLYGSRAQRPKPHKVTKMRLT